MDGSGRARRALILAVLIASTIAFSALQAGAASTPTLTLKLTSVDDVKVSWAFDALATRNGSVLEVHRSTNGSAFAVVKSASRPRPTGSFTNDNVPNGVLTYKARLVINGTPQAFGAEKTVKVGSVPTTAPTTVTTTAPTTPTTQAGTPGTHKWSRQLGGRSWVDSAVIEDVTVAPNGTTIAVGSFTWNADFGRGTRTAVGGNDAFVAAFHANGTAIWDRTFGGTGMDGAYGVSAGPNGQIAVVGYFSSTAITGTTSLTSAGGTDGFVLSLDSAGALLWTSRLGGTNGDSASAVAVGDSVTVTGNYTGAATIGGTALSNAGGMDVFVADLALGNGAPRWSTRYGTATNDRMPDIAVDSADRAVITGYTDTSGSSEIFAAQYGSTGAPVWSRKYGAGVGTDVAIASNNDIVLAGLIIGTINFGGGALGPAAASDMFVARLGSNGTTHVWSKWFTNVAPFQYSDVVGGVAVDGEGDVVLTGSVIGSMNFGGGVTVGLTGRDPVIVKLAGTTGAYRWAHRLVSLDGDFNTATGIATAPGGDVVIGGAFKRGIRVAAGVELSAFDGTNARTDSFVSRFGA